MYFKITQGLFSKSLGLTLYYGIALGFFFNASRSDSSASVTLKRVHTWLPGSPSGLSRSIAGVTRVGFTFSIGLFLSKVKYGFGGAIMKGENTYTWRNGAVFRDFIWISSKRTKANKV